MTDYWAMMVQGFFVGLGTIAGQYVWTEHLKKHADKTKEIIKKGKGGIEIEL